MWQGSCLSQPNQPIPTVPSARLYVTGSVKIDPNHTGTEIHFIAERQSLTLALTRST